MPTRFSALGLVTIAAVLSGLVADGVRAEQKETYTIGMSQCNLGEPWRVQMNADIAKAAEARAGEVEVIFKDAQNDTLRQQSQIQEFISAGVDALIVSPKEAAPLTPVIAQAYKQGMPV